jgi:hypothetical protein
MITRRDTLGALAALTMALKSQAATDSLLPLKAGDVLVGCTELNDPGDDHRGRGRILHYDSALRLRQTIETVGTTHLVQGLRFAPDRTLWAFDAFAHQILRLGSDGRRLANFRAPSRGFSNVTFATDGRFFLGESFVGEGSRVPLQTRLPFVPGTRRLGDGHLFEFSPQGTLLRTHATPVHGGMGGFQGLSFSALAPDQRTMVYVSETGPRVMRWDLTTQRSLPDLIGIDSADKRFFFDLAFDGPERLLVLSGSILEVIAWPDGRSLHRWPLGSFGFATLSPPQAGCVYACNFFSGEVVRIELKDGQITARVQTGVRKSASGVAQVPG